MTVIGSFLGLMLFFGAGYSDLKIRLRITLMVMGVLIIILGFIYDAIVIWG